LAFYFHILTDITLTIPETTEIILRAGIVAKQCYYGTIKDWIVDNLWYKHKEEITCKNLGQYRYSLVYGIHNTVAPLKFCGHQIR